MKGKIDIDGTLNRERDLGNTLWMEILKAIADGYTLQAYHNEEGYLFMIFDESHEYCVKNVITDKEIGLAKYPMPLIYTIVEKSINQIKEAKENHEGSK